MKTSVHKCAVAAIYLISSGMSLTVSASSYEDWVNISVRNAALCSPSERVLFTCQVGVETLSVCLGNEASAEPDLTYVFGAKGKDPALKITSASRGNPKFHYKAERGWNGDSTVRLGALHGDTEYVVFKNTSKFRQPVQSAGVGILVRGQQQKVYSCTSNSYEDFTLLWSLDERPGLVSPAWSDSDPLKLPRISWADCVNLNKRDFTRYCPTGEGNF